MIYKEEDFTFQIPTIDPATPHNQTNWKQLISAAWERSLVRNYCMTKDEAVSRIAVDGAQSHRISVHAASVQDAMFAGAKPDDPSGI